MIVLDRPRIEDLAHKAAKVAHTVLGLDDEYSIVLYEKPEMPCDAYFNTYQNEIQINLSQIKPFPEEAFCNIDGNPSDNHQLPDEDARLHLKICFLVFHEMRHLYQKKVVNVFSINERMGEHFIPPLESDKKAALWLEEMKEGCTIPPETRDVELDADAFAYYLTNRYPVERPMAQTSRRIGAMKRKYNKVPILEM